MHSEENLRSFKGTGKVFFIKIDHWCPNIHSFLLLVKLWLHIIYMFLCLIYITADITKHMHMEWSGTLYWKVLNDFLETASVCRSVSHPNRWFSCLCTNQPHPTEYCFYDVRPTLNRVIFNKFCWQNGRINNWMIFNDSKSFLKFGIRHSSWIFLVIVTTGQAFNMHKDRKNRNPGGKSDYANIRIFKSSKKTS